MSRSASARANRRGEPPPSPEPLPAPALDSHTHLDIVLGERPAGDEHGEWASDDDVDAEIAAAAAVGVPRLVQVGVDVPSSRWSAALAARHPTCSPPSRCTPTRPAPGRRPTTRWPRSTGSRRCRGCGRWGRPASTGTAPGPRDGRPQEASFRAHIRIAKEHGVALVIHDRDAHDEILRVLEDEGAPEHTVFHCFSGDAAFAKACVERGYVLSFAGTAHLRQRRLPPRGGRADARSTSCWSRPTRPFLTPMPHRGRPNASRLVPHTVRALAEVTGIDLDELCHHLTATAERVFGTWEARSPSA